jgi:hypothetical protein
MTSPTTDPNDIVKARTSLRSRLDNLIERQTWAHHVADLRTGQVETTLLNRPVAPLSRVKRLSRLAPHLDTSIFNGPSYTLTPRKPYLRQPEAWMIASVPGDFSSLEDMILWQLPRDATSSDLRQLECFFSAPPTRRSLITIVVSGMSWQGRTGMVSAGVLTSATRIQVPFSPSFSDHTIDIVFDPIPGQPADVFMVPESGIEMLLFRSMTIREMPPVLDPGPF